MTYGEYNGHVVEIQDGGLVAVSLSFFLVYFRRLVALCIYFFVFVHVLNVSGWLR